MKNTFLKIGLCLTSLLFFLGCIKQIEKQYSEVPLAEIDAAVLNSVATGVNYPIIARYPRPGFPINTTNSTTSCSIPQADSTLRRLVAARTVSIRVNLIGAQSSEDRVVGYRILTASPITTFAFPATVAAVTTTTASCGALARTFPGQVPVAAAATLNVTNATPGVEYTALTGKVTIPANSSYGNIQIQLLNPAASVGQARFLGIQLDSSGTILPSLNYRTIGLVIDQR